MTIPKRDKRRKRGELKDSPFSSIADKVVEFPIVDRMIRNYPRTCPYCGQGSYSTICKCGRLTRFKVVTK